MANQIRFKVGYEVDKSALNEIRNSLQTIQKMTSSDLMSLNKGMDLTTANAQLKQIKQTASQVQEALSRSFNSDLGTFNISKFNSELKNLDINRVYNDFASAGVAGQSAFRNITSQVLTTNMQLKQTHSLLDNMATTMANTIKWGVASSVMNTFTNNVQRAFEYVQKLDTSLNDIRIVTGKSADDMERFAENANKTAKELSASTRDITEGALIYYQQGDTDEDAMAKAEITQKAANVSQISAEDASEYLTAVWNGYQVANEAAQEGMQVYEEYVDKLAAVSAATASDLEESSIAMSKVASSANAMGVDFDQLNAQIATIISVTRQAPESVGTALKTIYARLGDLAIDGEDEFGTTLGDVSGKMKQMGIDVVDETGNLRDMGTVIEEVAAKWDTWTEAQRQAAAVAMAGKRQYNNLIALFDNWDMYVDVLNTSQTALGTLQEQQDIYTERTSAHIQNMKTSFEDLYDSILDTNSINTVVDLIGNAANGMATFVDSVGGGGNALLGLGSIAVNVFSKQIASSINTTITNFQNARENVQALKSEVEALKQIQNSQAMQDPAINSMIQAKETMQQYYSLLSNEQINVGNQLVRELGQARDLQAQWEANTQAALEYVQTLMAEEGTGLGLEDLDPGSSAVYESIAFNLDQAKKSITEANIASQNMATTMQRYETETESVNNNWGTVYDAIDRCVAQAEELSTRTDISAGNAEKLRNALNALNWNNLDIDNVSDIIESGFSGIDGQQLQQKLYNLRTAMTNTTSEMSSSVTNATNVINREFSSATAKSQELAQGVERASDSVNKFNNQAKQMANINTFVKLTSAIGQAAFAFNTFVNLYDIWNNKDLTTGEKTVQTVTALASILPMLPMMITSIKAAVTGLSTALNVSSGVIGLVAIGITGLVTLLAGLATASEKAAEQEKAFYEAQRDKALALEEENAAVQSLYETYSNYYSIYSQTGENKDELRDATIELCDALGIEIDTLDLLSDSYDKVNSKIAEARQKQAKEALDTAQEGVDSAGMALMLNSSDASDYDKNWRDIKFDAGWAGNDEEEVSNFLNERLEALGQDMQVNESGTVSQDFIINNIKSLEDFVATYEAIQEAYNDMATEFKDSPGTLTDSEIYSSIGTWLEESKSDYESYIKLQEDLVTYAKQFADATAQLKVSDFNIEEVNSLDEFKQYRDQYKQALEETFKQEGIDYTQEQLEEYTNEYLSTLDSLSEYLDQYNIEEELRDRLSGTKDEINKFIQELKDNGDLDLVATLEIDEGASVEEIEKALSIAKAQAQEEVSSAGLDAISAAIDSLQENGNLDDLDEDQQKYSQEILQTAEGINGLSKASEEWAYIANTGVQEQIEWLTHLQAQEAANATKQVENRKALIEQEIELKEIQQERMQAQLEAAENEKASFEDKYSEEELAENEDYQDLINQIEELGQKILETDSAAKELQDTLDSTDWDFEVDMAGVDEILTVGDSLLSESEKIKEAAMLIGEGFIVAADDAQALADIYPALYENAQVLADGQVQLSADTVQSLLGDEQVLLNGDVEANVARIDGQIALLEAKKASAEAELQLAQAVAQGNVDLTKEQIETISNGRQQLTNYLMQLGMEEVDANKAVAAAMAGNMDEYNRITAGVADDTANNLAGALAAAATAAQSNSSNIVASIDAIQKQAVLASNAIRNMADGTATDGGRVAVGGGSAGGTGFSANTRTGNFQGSTATQSTASKPNVSDWISDIQLDISGYTQGIAQLNALKAKLLASQKDTNAALDSAKAGLGGSTPFEKDKGGSGKGGGSGTEKEEEPEILDQLEDEADLYHDVDLRIKEISKDLDRLQDQQEKLTGKDLIDNLNEQLDILEKQKEAYNDKLEIAKMEADAIKSVLKAQGVTFDADGAVANYFSAMQNKLNYVNQVIAKYNNMSAKEQEAYKDTVEKAKEDYETFKSLIDQYDELISDTIPDLEDEVQDALDKQIEIQIEKFTMEVELRLDMAEAERDFNEFKKKVIDGIKDDDILGNALANLTDFSSYYKPNGEGVIETLTRQVNETIDQINQINGGGTSTIYGDNKAQAMEDLKEYYDELMSQLEDVEDLVDEIEESYLDMIDEAKDKFDEQIDQYEYIADLMNHNVNIIGLLYGDDAYAQMAKYYDAQEKNNNAQLNFYRQQVDFWKQRLDAEEEGSEAWLKYKENWEDAVSGLNSTVENSIQNLIDKYTNVINQIFDELNNKLTDNKGLDYISEEWDLINQNADSYLDTINSMYEIQKLENKYLDAIDNTDSLSAQQKLNDLMTEQLEMLRDKEKLTQYDVDRANALYEIALKEIALQDAQQNKSKMRLRRDSQGNYSYQYVSDEDSIAQAQQELADAQNSLYNMDKDQYRNNLNEIYSIYSEFQQKLLELYQDQTLTEEEREEKKKLLAEQYGELINGLVEQNETIRQNLQESTFQELANLYNVDVSNFLEMSEAEKDILMNSMIPQWDSGIQQMTDKFAGEGGFISSCEEAFQKLDEITKNYQDSLDDLEASAGIDFDSIAEGYDKNIQYAQELLYANDDLINKYNEQINAIQSVITQVDQLIAKYTQAKNEAIAATEAAYKYWQQENAKAAAEAAKNSGSNSGSGGSSSGGSGGSSGSGGKGSGSGGGDGVPRIGDVVTYTGGLYYYDSYGQTPTGSRGAGKKVTITYMNSGAPYPIHVESSDSAYGWLKQSQISGYDTGGYTGDWNSSEGKIGLLHQKELVLNKDDTENFLSAINIVRNLDNVLQSLNLSMMNRLFGLLKNIGDISSGISANNDLTVEQKVQIEANFPNVKDSSQIEEAFTNLVNYASQHAYDTRR